MHVCMHVCMYACMHVCMYACMHVCMYACMHVCMRHACMHACMHVWMDGWMDGCICLCILTCIWVGPKDLHTCTLQEVQHQVIKANGQPGQLPATSHVLMHLLPGAKSRPIQNFLTPWLGLWGVFSQGPHCLNHRGDPQLAASRKSPIHPGCVAPTEAWSLGNRCSILINPDIAIIPLNHRNILAFLGWFNRLFLRGIHFLAELQKHPGHSETLSFWKVHLSGVWASQDTVCSCLFG